MKPCSVFTRKAFGSLRTRLLALVLLCTLPAMGIIVYMAQAERESQMRAVQEGMLRLVRLAASSHEQIIESTHVLLLALARLPQVLPNAADECNGLMADLLKQYPAYINMGVMEPNGDLFCSAVPPPNGPVNVSDRDYFKRLLKTGEFTISDFIIGRAAVLPNVTMALPVFGDEGKIRSVIFAALDVGMFGRIPARVKLPEEARLLVIDHGGTVLARYPEADDLVGRNLRDAPIVRRILEQGEGVAEEVGLDGTKRLIAFTPLSGAPETSAYVVISFSSSVAFAQANRILWLGLLGMVFVAVLAVAAVFVGGESTLIAPIRKLIEATERIASGDLSARSDLYGAGEFNQLARAFDHMAHRIEELVEDLREALARIKTLKGLLPICAWCKKIRDDQGYWKKLETYLREHSDADFTHGVCPECAEKIRKDLYAKKPAGKTGAD